MQRNHERAANLHISPSIIDQSRVNVDVPDHREFGMSRIYEEKNVSKGGRREGERGMKRTLVGWWNLASPRLGLVAIL